MRNKSSNPIMTQRSKKGKFRPSGIVSKVKFDLLPPKGDPEVSITGLGGLAIASIIVALLLSPFAEQLAMMLALGVVLILLIRLGATL